MARNRFRDQQDAKLALPHLSRSYCLFQYQQPIRQCHPSSQDVALPGGIREMCASSRKAGTFISPLSCSTKMIGEQDKGLCKDNYENQSHMLLTIILI